MTARAGKERREQNQHDGPAADGARAEVDVGGGALRQLDVVVERFEQRLTRPADAGQARGVERCRECRQRRRRAVAGRREGDAATLCATKGACSYRLSGKARSRSCERRARASGRVPVCSRTRAAAVRTSAAERIAGRHRRKRGVGGRSRRSSPGRRPRRLDPVAVVRDEVLGAEASESPSVAGEEQDRVIRLGRTRRGLRSRVRARQLEQRCRSRAVVVRAWARAAVVAVREHDDDLVRSALAQREQVLELHAAAAGDFRVKTLALGARPYCASRSGDPGLACLAPTVPGARSGFVVRERAIGEDGGGAVEVRLQRRSAAAAAGAKTVNAEIRSGIPTRSHVPRYIRLFTGRSGDPGRGRRRCRKGGWAAMRGNSRDDPGTISPDAGLFDHPPRRRRGLRSEAADVSAGTRRVPRRLRAGR